MLGLARPSMIKNLEHSIAGNKRSKVQREEQKRDVEPRLDEREGALCVAAEAEHSILGYCKLDRKSVGPRLVKIGVRFFHTGVAIAAVSSWAADVAARSR